MESPATPIRFYASRKLPPEGLLSSSSHGSGGNNGLGMLSFATDVAAGLNRPGIADFVTRVAPKAMVAHSVVKRPRRDIGYSAGGLDRVSLSSTTEKAVAPKITTLRIP